jgi:protein SCO1/2
VKAARARKERLIGYESLLKDEFSSIKECSMGFGSQRNDEVSPMARRRMMLGSVLAAGAALAPWRGVRAAGEDHSHHHHHHEESTATSKAAQRSEVAVKLPDVTLVRQDGAKVPLLKELDDGAPVMLTFIYTSCTTVCPVMSKIFSDVQGLLGKDLDRAKMVSVSIDPEYDTPPRLVEYAKRFGAGPRWQHYTGTVSASLAVQKAFNAYFGDKMSHRPVVFLRAKPGNPWVRYEGFAAADVIAREYRTLVARA